MFIKLDSNVNRSPITDTVTSKKCHKSGFPCDVLYEAQMIENNSEFSYGCLRLHRLRILLKRKTNKKINTLMSKITLTIFKRNNLGREILFWSH